MVPLALICLFTSMLMAGGIAFTFRSPDPTPHHAQTLFVTGLVSTLATVVVVSGAFSLHGPAGFLVHAMSLALPGLLYISAGLGFRRSWHTGTLSFALLGGLMLTGLVSRTAAMSTEIWSLWTAFAWKLTIFALLLHAISSLWSGRDDDMDVVRRPARYPLTALFTATLIVSIIFRSSSNILLSLLAICWIAISIVIYTMRVRMTGRTTLSDDRKLSELRALFDQRRIYREDDLTLERIGDRLLLSNDDVRHLIHLGMGFRRLGDLLDHYRVNAARIILEDADQVETRLNEVAISVGYRSLGPFEAAFERLTGESAGDFRRRHLDMANAARPLQLTNTDR